MKIKTDEGKEHYDLWFIVKGIGGLNFRIPRNFGPPHLHVSGGFEDRGITQ